MSIQGVQPLCDHDQHPKRPMVSMIPKEESHRDGPK